MLSKPKEVMDLFIEPNIGLQLAVEYKKGEFGAAGRYVLAGPPRVLKMLRKAGLEASKSGLLEGVISPKGNCSLPTAARQAASIPEAATNYAFVYPMRQFMEMKTLTSINLSDEPWGFALLLGAFAYFSADGKLLAVNALTIVPSPAVLHLVGPYQARHSTTLALARLGRMRDVAVDGLRDIGYRRFGWLCR